jgi:hypothetical protein
MICSSCGNEFLQPFVCTTCGAQKLRDETVKALEAEVKTLREALIDMRSGWKYIREYHGDLYGVGWDRAQDKADAALAAREGR